MADFKSFDYEYPLDRFYPVPKQEHIDKAIKIYQPGRRVSVLDSMMWKMYRFHVPKPRPFKWEIIKPMPHIKATWDDK